MLVKAERKVVLAATLFAALVIAASSAHAALVSFSETVDWHLLPSATPVNLSLEPQSPTGTNSDWVLGEADGTPEEKSGVNIITVSDATYAKQFGNNGYVNSLAFNWNLDDNELSQEDPIRPPAQTSGNSYWYWPQVDGGAQVITSILPAPLPGYARTVKIYLGRTNARAIMTVLLGNEFQERHYSEITTERRLFEIRFTDDPLIIIWQNRGGSTYSDVFFEAATTYDSPLIPEPATATLLALAGAALILQKRRS